jgi:NADH-quinone oxidoreductase subunit E
MKDGLEGILQRYKNGGKSALIPVLQEVQQRLGHLPKEEMYLIAGFLGVAESLVYGVATFYNQFRFTPLGKQHIRVCMGTACHMQGGKLVSEALERELDIKIGDVTPDHEFSLERVACIGCCAIAPVMVVNETVHPKMAPFKVEEALVKLKTDPVDDL